MKKYIVPLGISLLALSTPSHAIRIWSPSENQFLDIYKLPYTNLAEIPGDKR
ncbi:hypothetical protein [Aquifex aeolicus]|uniref:hypothetical protein n=1 Tax=Aquifex aeolicus TaxID=63363 RepID=UPI0002F58201|nr:hypothetical protein [Aquifex aeolicus]